MATNSFRPKINGTIEGIRVNRSLAFGVIITVALFAFEIFNYGTTDYALSDLLGDLKFAGLRWATILAIAFCGIDFAGIARLFAPELGREQNENWFLFGAWLLAATMNAMLTWWGISLAILNHQPTGDMVIARETMIRVGPVFVAVLVWLIRVLIIGTFSVAGDRMFQNATEYTSSASISRQNSRSKPASAINPTIAKAPPLSNTRPGRPLTSDPTIIASNKPPSRSQPASVPRNIVPQLEPTYSDDEEIGYSDPSYAHVPLAAKPAGRSNLASFNSPNGPAKRTPMPRNRS